MARLRSGPRRGRDRSWKHRNANNTIPTDMHMLPCSHRTHAAVPGPRVVIDAGLSGLRRLLTDCDAIYCITVLQVRAVVLPRVPARPDQRLRTASPSRLDTAHLTTVSCNPWVSARTCKCKTLKQGRIRSRQDRLYTQHVYLAVRVIGLRLPVIRAHELLHTHAYSSHDLAAISRNPLPSFICTSHALLVNGNHLCVLHDQKAGSATAEEPGVAIKAPGLSCKSRRAPRRGVVHQLVLWCPGPSPPTHAEERENLLLSAERLPCEMNVVISCQID
jgi:hypothetical protein